MNHLIVPAIHLTILISFIVYKTKTPFIQFLGSRYKEIYEGLNRSKIQAAEAAAKKREIEQKLASLESEKSKINQEWKERSEAQKKAILDGSQKMVSQMKSEGAQNGKALEESFKQIILKNFSKTVITQAEAKVKSALNAETHKNLNDRFLDSVSKQVGV